MHLLKTLLFGLLVSDILNDRLLVQTDGAHTVPFRPEMQPGEIPPMPQAFSVDLDGRLPFQKADRVGHAELRRDTQTQVDVVRHRMSLHNLHTLLLTQISKDPSDLLPQIPVDCAPPILPDKHNVILAVPFHVGLALPISHDDLLPV